MNTALLTDITDYRIFIYKTCGKELYLVYRGVKGQCSGCTDNFDEFLACCIENIYVNERELACVVQSAL